EGEFRRRSVDGERKTVRGDVICRVGGGYVLRARANCGRSVANVARSVFGTGRAGGWVERSGAACTPADRCVRRAATAGGRRASGLGVNSDRIRSATHADVDGRRLVRAYERPAGP